jgi:hypothetical protein
MVVLEVEVMVKILRMQLEKHLEFTEPEAVEVVAPPAENLVVLVSLSFIILGHN